MTGHETERAIVITVDIEIFVVGMHVAPSYGIQLVLHIVYNMTTIVAFGDVM